MGACEQALMHMQSIDTKSSLSNRSFIMVKVVSFGFYLIWMEPAKRAAAFSIIYYMYLNYYRANNPFKSR